MARVRRQIVEIRQETAEAHYTLLTLICGHVMRKWCSVARIGDFEECEDCEKREADHAS